MGYDVASIQRRLSDLGFDPGPADGLMGPRTEAAIVAFKKSVGLAPRPHVGPLTHEALMGSSDRSDMPWMAEAIRMRGIHEARDASKLKAWLDRAVSWIDPREVAWCGAFVATCFRKWKHDIALPENPLGARNWGKFGDACPPQLGAVMTFWRGSKSGWQGHVGFYWGEDKDAFHILGGNQSDAVTITRISRARFLDARWPSGAAAPGKVIILSASGGPLSTNEA